MTHTYYSLRNGYNKRSPGLPLDDILPLFIRVYEELEESGYFTQAFGYACVDLGYVPGNINDVDLEILLSIRKKNLWPPSSMWPQYAEDDFFDIIEFLFQHVSRPIDGDHHSYNQCGMHWHTFDKKEGQVFFRLRVNSVLSHYEKNFELSESGEILNKPEHGFEGIFEAEIPAQDIKITERIDAAIIRYRRHGSTLDDRRQAVRDLADVLEYIRPQIKSTLTSADEKDLFNLANNFGIRHHNASQKTSYDSNIWLSWMFYFYLSTIHVVLRKKT